jgi:FAD/FMN-containing dehydrogenase
VEQVAQWAAQLAIDLPPTMEVVLVLASGPPGAPAGPAGKVVGITAAAFTDTEEDAGRLLSRLESCPVLDRALVRIVNKPSSFEMLQGSIGMLLPEHHRYAADSMWSGDSVAALLPRLAEQLVSAPSQRSAILAPLLSRGDGRALPDAAFSKVDRSHVLCYAIWDEATDDSANEEWLRQTVGSIAPSVTGHYIAEADLSAGASKSITSYAPANWERLAALKRQHDPDDLFYTYLGL